MGRSIVPPYQWVEEAAYNLLKHDTLRMADE